MENLFRKLQINLARLTLLAQDMPSTPQSAALRAEIDQMRGHLHDLACEVQQ